MKASERVRLQHRMAYPAHEQTVRAWGECVWTSRDVLLASNPMLRWALDMAGYRERILAHPVAPR